MARFEGLGDDAPERMRGGDYADIAKVELNTIAAALRWDMKEFLELPDDAARRAFIERDNIFGAENLRQLEGEIHAHTTGLGVAEGLRMSALVEIMELAYTHQEKGRLSAVDSELEEMGFKPGVDFIPDNAMPRISGKNVTGTDRDREGR